MKTKVLTSLLLWLTTLTQAQTISIVGTGVNGWPGEQTTPEITLTTNDNISYVINNLEVSSGEVKFRKDYSWTINWGGSTFPSGTGIQDGPNIITTAGTYDVTFNISNGTYTFIPSSSFPSIGIWGPAVNSQLGYAAPDVDMNTTDGIIYTLSGFYFSSGQAYFRQDNATNFLWGSTTFPTGTAVLSGPSLFIPSGEFFVTFNRVTGEYSFSFPGIGILGTALNGFDSEDTDLNTADGFFYSIDDLALSAGEVKFRKDNSWLTNWGAVNFPNGTGVQDGPNIPVNEAGNYSITFDRLSGQYNFSLLLNTDSFSRNELRVYPNPSADFWFFDAATESIIAIELFDGMGKLLHTSYPNRSTHILDGSLLQEGLYFGRVKTTKNTFTMKINKR